mmetsp:Transcript_32292/g.47368  ORF Transcript_32292/g.47368 Transcript_32292/m.47368 type:complete len:663 (-) Transcript_32292:186-2174(-)
MDSLPRWLQEVNPNDQCDLTFVNTNPFIPAPYLVGLSNSVRFGKPSSFSSLFSADDQAGYITGLIYFASIFLILFIVLTILLIVLKVMGPGNAGFLSGYHFVEPDPKMERKPYRTPTIVRTVFMICALSVVAFSVVGVTEGYDNLQKVFNTVDDSTDEVIRLLEDAQQILDVVSTVGRSSIEVVDALSQSLNNFCPNFDLLGETGINFDDISSSVSSALDDISPAVDTIENIEQTINSGIDTLERVQDIEEDFILRDWYMMVYIIPLIICTSLLMVSTILAWMDFSYQWYQRLSTYIIFPIFFLLVIIGSILAVVLGAASAANADLCTGGSGNPSIEGTIMEILELRRADFDRDSLLYTSVVYYIQGCQIERDPFDFITDSSDLLIEANDQLTSLEMEIDAIGLEKLSLLCGRDFGPTRTLISTSLTNMKTLNAAIIQIQSLICCERINRIYVLVAQQGTCNFLVTGLTWFFSSFVVVAICGLIMSMFRAAWLDVEYATGDEILEQPISKVDNPMARYKSSIITSGAMGIAGAGLANSAEYDDESDYEENVESTPGGRAFVGDENYDPSSTKSWEKYPIGVSQDPPGDHDDANNDTYNEEDFHKYDEAEDHIYDDDGRKIETEDHIYDDDSRHNETENYTYDDDSNHDEGVTYDKDSKYAEA